MHEYNRLIHIAKTIGIHNEQLKHEGSILGLKNTTAHKINEVVITKTLRSHGISITHLGENFGPDALMCDGRRVEIKTTALRKDRKIRPSDNIALFGQQSLYENRLNALSYEVYVFGIVDHVNFEPVPLLILFSSPTIVAQLKQYITRMQESFLKTAERYYDINGVRPRYDGINISIYQVLAAVNWQPDLFILNGVVRTDIKQAVQPRKSILLESY